MIVVTTRELGAIPVEAAAQVLGVPDGELLVIIRKEDGPVDWSPKAAPEPVDDLDALPPRPAISSLVVPDAPDVESDAHPQPVYTPSFAPPASAAEVDAARAALQRQHDTLAISAATLGLKEGTWGQGSAYGRPWWRCGSQRLP